MSQARIICNRCGYVQIHCTCQAVDGPDIFSPSGAVFSQGDEAGAIYRHMLWRYWGPGRAFLHFCGLNPSTAGHTLNDPTIRREIDFAKRWGFDGLLKTNAFDLRATDPKVMMAHPDPLSPENDQWIHWCSVRAGLDVAAWGVHGVHLDRANNLKSSRTWRCLGKTKEGHPRHPLYVKATTELIIL